MDLAKGNIVLCFLYMDNDFTLKFTYRIELKYLIMRLISNVRHEIYPINLSMRMCAACVVCFHACMIWTGILDTLYWTQSYKFHHTQY